MLIFKWSFRWRRCCADSLLLRRRCSSDSLKTRAYPGYSCMKQLGVFLLHPGLGTSWSQGYTQGNFATAGESRVYVGLGISFQWVTGRHLLTFDWVKKKWEIFLFIQFKMQRWTVAPTFENLGNAMRCEICSYPMQQKSYRDRDCCSGVSTCNALRAICNVEVQLKIVPSYKCGLNGILIGENKSQCEQISPLRTPEMHVLFVWLVYIIH